MTEKEWLAEGFAVKPHTEERGFNWLKKNEITDVRAIYSELEPCVHPKHFCKQNIKNKFPNAKVSYSYAYPYTQSGMKKAIADRAKDLKKYLKK